MTKENEKSLLLEKLQYQLQLEKMVSAISGSFVNISATKINGTINQVLELLGDFLNVERSYIFLFSDDGQTMSVTHEWNLEGIEPQLPILQNYPVSNLPFLMPSIRNMQHTCISDVAALPPEANREKAELQRQDIRSLLVVPFSLKDDGFANGFLGFDAVREKKAWTDQQIYLLKVVAEIISGALEKQLVEREREQAENALKEREEQLSITLQSIGDGVIATDTIGKITRMNPQAEKLTGWLFKEAAGKPLDEVFHIVNASTGEAVCSPAQLVIKTGKIMGMANDTSLIARDGTVRQIGDSAAPIRDSKGRVSGVVIVFSDVSEQYKAREALRQSEVRYRTIVENTNDALLVYNFQGNIIDVNENACRLLGYGRSELLGANLSMINSPADHGQISVRREQLLLHDRFLFEGTLIRSDGSSVPVEISAKLVSRDGGGIIQGFVRDITERKLAEEKFAQYTKDLEKLYRQLNEEIDKARQVHERTLPREIPRIPGISLATHYHPAQKLGGDFYDVIRKGSKIIIYLSDVTGHGVDGAMLSFLVKHTIRGYLNFAAQKAIFPEEILGYLNAQFRQENLPENYFICIFFAVLDLDTMELSYSGAGFQDTPLVHLGNGEKVKLHSRGLFLSSAFPDEIMNFKADRIHLTPGTTIFLNTDGLTEQGSDGIYYGSRLPAVFYGHSHLPPQLIAQSVCEDFRQFNNGSLQGKDDITFLVLQVDPPELEKHRMKLTSDLQELKQLRENVLRITGSFAESGIFMICLNEIVANAMEHGNRLNPEKPVLVELTVTDSYIHAVVEDRGEGFNWQEAIDSPLELEGLSERGRGIAISRLCLRLNYNEKGNRAMLTVLTNS